MKRKKSRRVRKVSGLVITGICSLQAFLHGDIGIIGGFNDSDNIGYGAYVDSSSYSLMILSGFPPNSAIQSLDCN